MKTNRIGPFFSSLLLFLCLIPAVEGPAAASPVPEEKDTYSGPRSRISVATIRDKTAGGGMSIEIMEKFNMPWKAIGEGMREMLVTALFQTKRFAILERELLEEIMREQALGASGNGQGDMAPEAGSIVSADLIITGAVTEFVTDSLTIEGGGNAWGTDVDGTLKKGYVGLDIRIIDSKTSEVVVATYVMGKANSYGVAARPGEEAKLPVSLSIFARTPAERAIRNAIKLAVDDIVSMVPAKYFKY